MNTPFTSPRDDGTADLDAFARDLDTIVAGDARASSDLGRFADGIQRGSGTIQRGNVSRHAYPLRGAERARIWEDVLTGGRAARRGPLPRRAERRNRKRERPEVRSGALRFVPETQPTVTFLLVIAVLIAIGASFNSMAPGRMGDLTPTALAQGQGQTGQASPDATPDAVPTTVVDPIDEPFLAPVSPTDCTVEPRPLDEVGDFVRDPGPLLERAYLPATDVDQETAIAAAESARGWEACSFEGEPGQRRAYESPRFIFEDPGNAYFGKTGSEVLAENLETYRAFSAEVLGEDVARYVLFAENLFVGTPIPSGFQRPNFTFASLPSNAVRLADGRIAIPQSIVYDSHNTPTSGVGMEAASVIFTVLTQDPTQNGRWVVDEQFPGCTGDCDAFWGQYETLITDAGLEPAPASPVDIVQVDDGTFWPVGTPLITYPPTPVLATPHDDGTVWPVSTPFITYPPAPVLAAPQANAANVDLPTAAGCTVEPLTVDEVMAIVADPTATDGGYGPIRSVMGTPSTSVMGTPATLEDYEAIVGEPVRTDSAVIDAIAIDHREWTACVLADSWFQVWALSTGTAIQSDVFARLYAPTTTESDARAILESLERDGAFAYLETPFMHYGFDEGIPLVDPDPAASLQVEVGTVHVSTITYDAAGSALGRGSTYSYRLNETFDRWLFDGCIADCPEQPFQSASADATDAGRAGGLPYLPERFGNFANVELVHPDSNASRVDLAGDDMIPVAIVVGTMLYTAEGRAVVDGERLVVAPMLERDPEDRYYQFTWSNDRNRWLVVDDKRADIY